VLQVITATRILDYRELSQAERERAPPLPAVELSHDKGEGDDAVSSSPSLPDVLNLQDVIESQSPRMALAAEFKRASPSKGRMLAESEGGGDDGDPASAAERQAVRYASAGACIVSVLTEPRWFEGSLRDLRRVRDATATATTTASCLRTRPAVLRKDFVVSREMVDEAAFHGADTVLLIVAILPSHRLKALIAYCRERWNMEPLVEVHADEELRVALESGATVIGVNNRNLHTFRLDMGTSTRIAAALARHVAAEENPDRSRHRYTLCALSGMSTADDVDRYRRAGIRMCLIGESLMRSPDPRRLIQDLCLDPDDYEKRKKKEKNLLVQEDGAPVAGGVGTGAGIGGGGRGRCGPYADGVQIVKVCGITSEDDATAACRAGASLVGVIFADNSPRRVTVETAAAVVRAVRRFGE
jgi:anthranilate synthase/indole-3-glycerol phosphate synthase/phosphoribosylanthranilate isomerase